VAHTGDFHVGWLTGDFSILITNTEKPRYNESEGTKNCVLYSRGFVIAVAFYNKITTEELRIKFFIGGILLLKVSLYRGFSVSSNVHS
jgi:hypothetical protein